MNYIITLKFNLEIIKSEDRGGDEPRIQVAFVRVTDGNAKVFVSDTGRLANNFPGRRTSASGTRKLSGLIAYLPSYDTDIYGPYLAIVARAIEDDESSDSNRRRDRENFGKGIEVAAQNALDSGRTPNVDELWLAGNSVKLADRRLKDDDDKIGVSARVYESAGTEILRSFESFEHQVEFQFVEDDAHYRLDGILCAQPDPLI